MLTKKQEEKYLQVSGLHCPFCGSDNISGGDVDADIVEVWQEMSCLGECQRVWYTIYKLIDWE